MLTLAAAFMSGALVVGGLVFAVNRPSSTERMADRLRVESAQRDREPIRALTELARTTRDRRAPVLDGLDRAMPADGGIAATPANAAKWRQAAVKDFADLPSGETATNVAASILASAIRQIANAVGTYATSQALAGPSRETVMALTVRRRADAVFTWSVGATALDAVNGAAGYGHQHVFLPASPGSRELTADPGHEGSNS